MLQTVEIVSMVALMPLFGVEFLSWTFTQPVNKFWLQSTTLGSIGNTFFEVGSERQHRHADGPDGWKKLRDRGSVLTSRKRRLRPSVFCYSSWRRSPKGN
jgi:hypothetical protein